jgi:heme/copper-type cytochrome/quinol oxidase subunit 1
MKLKPELLYPIVAVVLMALGFLSSDVLDIAVYDMYFVVGAGQFFMVGALFFLLFAVISWLFGRVNRPLNNRLSILHFFITALFLGMMVLLVVLSSTTEPARYYDYNVYEGVLPNQDSPNYNAWITTAVLILLFTQLLLILNIITSISQGKKH